MANSKSALKRLRNSKTANLRNRSRKNELKTLEKNLRTAIEAGDAAEAGKLHKLCCSRVDKAAMAGTIHGNKAANKKSQFDKLINSLAK